MADLIGQTVGKYRVVARLGRGGMAEVYKAYQPGLDRYVAIKVLHSHLAEDADFIGRFEREARAVANLRHPNIVQVFDFDMQQQMYYMAMEFIEGPTLKAELLERSRKESLFTLDETIRIMVALCGAIDYAHSRGMVHRDLKPANFILTKDGQILILDFGIAKIVGATQYTVTGAMSGTPAYMSPEQGQGERGDERSDIYSLGVVLYEMVTGKVPFDADTPFAVIMKHITNPLPLPRSINPDIPEAFERIILKALSKNPDDRYQSGGEFAVALRETIGMSPYDTLVKNPVTTIAPNIQVGEELQPTDPTFSQAKSQAVQQTVARSSAAPPQPADLKTETGTTITITGLSPVRLAMFGGAAIILLLIVIGIIFGLNNAKNNTTAKNATAEALIESESAQTETAQAAAMVVATSSATDTPVPATPTPGPTPTPTDTPDLDATIESRLTATGVALAISTADAVGTQAASVPTDTPIPDATDTPLPTDTPPPTNTAAPRPPTNTPVPVTPTTAAPPTAAASKVSGRIAVPIDNGSGRYDLWFYSAAGGDVVLKIEGARQPAFRSDGKKLLVNGEGEGRDDIWEVNAVSGAFEKPVSGSPTDSHPWYSPYGDRLAYGNPNLAIGSDGNNHPFLFVQCSLNRPQDEGDQTCSDVARFGVLVPAGQVGEIQGSNPVWTGDDRIVYKGCNTWAGGNSCGIFIVGSWANKRSGNGETPVKLPGIDGTSTTPTGGYGTNILFHAFENNNWDVFLTSVSGGATNLTNAPGSNEGMGTFSPDGKQVAFVSDRSGWGVWVVPVTGGNATKLFDLPGAPWGAGDHDWTNERIAWGP